MTSCIDNFAWCFWQEWDNIGVNIYILYTKIKNNTTCVCYNAIIEGEEVVDSRKPRRSSYKVPMNFYWSEEFFLKCLNLYYFKIDACVDYYYNKIRKKIRNRK